MTKTIMTKTEMKREAQAEIIHAALTIMYKIGDGHSAVDPVVARKEIARIEKLFDFEPYSFGS